MSRETANRFTDGLFARMRHRGLLIYASGLTFLGFVLVPAFGPGVSSATTARLIGLCLIIAVAYVGTTAAEGWSLRARWGWIGFIVGSICLLLPDVGWSAVYFVFYVTIAQAALLPFRQARIAIAVTGLLVSLGSVLQPDWLGTMLGLASIVSAYAMLFGIEEGRNLRKVQALEQRNSVLAVAVERERIGRDLHDILGHSLTAVAVKSQLARRLVEKDPAAAIEQIGEVETIARQALTDVRATASGMREVSAASELASAQSVLRAAGIEPDVSSAAPLLGPELNELFGFAIREAVTNVVRHADARTCRIELSESRVRIIDDGQGAQGRRGNGLIGLGERARESGASLILETGAGGLGTVVEVRSGLVAATLEEAI